MRNKRLLVILIIFLVVGTLAILGGTVFSVQTITVRFYNELDYFVDVNDSEAERAEKTARLESNIAASLSHLKGKNILFSINEDKITRTIEEYKYDPGNTESYEGFRLNVTNVKASFPNKLVITVRERYAVYDYSAGGQTVVLDGDLRVLDKKPPKDGRRLIDLKEALPDVETQSLEIGGYLVSAHPERESIIKEVMPFFTRIESNEDAVTYIFGAFEFVSDLLDESGATSPLSLKMTQWVSSPVTEPNKNFFELHIIDADKRTKDKLVKIWQAVEDNQKAPGVYEVFDVSSPYENDGLDVSYTA